MKKIIIAGLIFISPNLSASETQTEIYNYIKESSGLDNRKYSISLQYAYLYFQDCKYFFKEDIRKFQASKAFMVLYQDHQSPYINVSKVQNAINSTGFSANCEER